MTSTTAWGFAKMLAATTLVTLPVFLLTEDSQVSRFAKLGPTAALVVLAVTAMGLIGVQQRMGRLVLGAVGLASAAGLLQLIQTGRDANLLGGNASTFSFLLALSLGWGGLAWAMWTETSAPNPAPSGSRKL